MASAIEVHHLWKAFTVSYNRSYSLKNKFLSMFYPALKETRERLWVLKDLNFSIARGETFGIIGDNGVGKSTLLYLIAQTIYPTRGQIVVNGLVAPMIQLGLGFNQEMTGLENIYLNLSLYGLTRKDIGKKIDSILDFSELDAFIDSPIKNYSSGMRARLGFSLAVHMDPDILLLDEVFAVGDISFQQKCIGKMHEFRRQNKTILFVSHSLQVVESLCDRSCFLWRGRVAGIGPSDEMVKKYRNVKQGLELPLPESELDEAEPKARTRTAHENSILIP